MSRRASLLNLPTGKKTSTADLSNIASPFGDSHRTPSAVSRVAPPRKSSKLGMGGSLYRSQDNICVSYLRKTSESNLMRPGQGLREPSVTRDSGVDLSKMYSHPEPPSTPDRRRRAVSEDRSVQVGIGWRGTGGRSVSRQSSRTNLVDSGSRSGSFRFLPPESVNQEEPPKLILKKTPIGGSRVSLYGNDPDIDGGDSGNRKKLSSGCQAGDISRREIEMGELLRKLEMIEALINKVEETAERLLKRQTESEEFQSQMKQELEGYDLQKGVYRVLDSVDYDRREYARLLKKVTEMQKRHSQGIFLDGENEELRSLIVGANDLEKKLNRSLEELERLANKTEALIERQRKILEERRRKMEEEAKKNSALMVLLKDASQIDKMLKDLSHVKSEHMKAEHIHRKIQEKVLNLDEDEMDTDEIVLQRIGVDTQTVTDDLLRIREDIHKIQDAAIDNLDNDVEVDVVGESEILRQKMGECKESVEQLKTDIEDFLNSQNKRFADFMRKLKEDEEESERRRREEEERLKLLEEEEERKRRLAAQKEKELSLLELEAEENRNKQRQEIIHMLDGDMIELHKMKDKVLVLVDKQKKIKHSRRKRRQLYTIKEEDESDEDLNKLANKTGNLFSFLADDENVVLSLKGKVESQDPNDVMEEVRQVEDGIIDKSRQIQELSEQTEKMLNDEKRMTDEVSKVLSSQEEQLALKKTQLFSDADDLHDSFKELMYKMAELAAVIEQLLNTEMQVNFEELTVKSNEFEISMREMQDHVKDLQKTSQDDIKITQLDKLENLINERASTLGGLHQESDFLMAKGRKLLYEKQKQDAEDERQKLRKDQEKLNSLQQVAKDVSIKQNLLEAQYKDKSDDDDEENRRKLEELERLMKQKEDLSDVEMNLGNISAEMEIWKEFKFTEEEEMEMNRYGMISSLAMPSFPAGLIKNPELLAAITKRHKELLELRKKLAREEQRMKEICEALDEMEMRQREAELARLAKQSKEWVHDFKPEGSAMFGTEPTFRSDFTMDPEEARAQAASRRASRMASRESSVAPVESLGL